MKKIIVIVLVMVVNTVFSQKESKLEKQFKAEFVFTGFGFSYELPLAKKWIVDLGAGIGGGVDESESYPSSFNSPAAYFKSEFKYVYNREKRLIKSKSIISNSGSYIALQAKYTTKRFSESATDEPSNNAILTDVHWGIQTPLGSNWLFNFHIGLGILRDLDNNNGLMSPTLGLKFSYILF